MAARIINELNSSPKFKGKKIKVVIDCPSVNRTSWRNAVMMHIEHLSNLEIVCEHKADKNHIAVSAASILAKEEREREMDLLRAQYDGIGSGYASDPKTNEFLKENIKTLEHKGLFRKTWKTFKNAKGNEGQKKLV